MTLEQRELLAKEWTGSIMQNGIEGRSVYSNCDGTEIYILEDEEAEDDEDFFVTSLEPIAEACANVAWYAYAGCGEAPSIEWIKSVVGDAVFTICFEAERQAKKRLGND